MHIRRITTALLVAITLVAACGEGDGGESTTTPVSPTTTVAATTTTGTSTTLTTITSPATTLPATTTTVVRLGQPAVWPAADVVFATPEEAAADFVARVLGVPPTLGEFQQDDLRSGEIEVFSPGEGEGAGLSRRGLLLLRQLGPDDSWFVIGAANEHATIASPEAMAVVPAGPLVVQGVARGFEATVKVSAFIAGDASAVLDMELTMGGAYTDEPYSVTLDLSGASPGDVVALLVRGDTALETDPGDFEVIPIVIAG
jgi:hypothetical protein